MKTTRAPFTRCVECNEVITNPICSECIAREIKEMVAEYDENLANKIDGFKIEGETCCISCGSLMALCAHCFSKDMYEFLNENNKVIAKEFLNRFDFELRREFM